MSGYNRSHSDKGNATHRRLNKQLQKLCQVHAHTDTSEEMQHNTGDFTQGFKTFVRCLHGQQSLLFSNNLINLNMVSFFQCFSHVVNQCLFTTGLVSRACAHGHAQTNPTQHMGHFIESFKNFVRFQHG